MIADGEYVPDLKNISDGQLFALIAAKDDLAHAAYRVLYDRYAQLIWSLCCDAGSKLVRWNKEQFVEELFSQTMIKIYVHPTYDPIRGKVSTWISGIARNTAFDLLKEWNDHTQTTVEPIPEFSSEEDESTTSSPLHLLLTQALEMLSDREKDILRPRRRHPRHPGQLRDHQRHRQQGRVHCLRQGHRHAGRSC